MFINNDFTYKALVLINNDFTYKVLVLIDNDFTYKDIFVVERQRALLPGTKFITYKHRQLKKDYPCYLALYIILVVFRPALLQSLAMNTSFAWFWEQIMLRIIRRKPVLSSTLPISIHSYDKLN